MEDLIFIIQQNHKLIIKFLFCFILFRWNSTYNMLARLLELKAFCQEHEKIYKKLYCSIEMWSLIDEIVQSLAPCSKATIRLQSENLTITDVYRILNLCHMETHQLGNTCTFPIVVIIN